jgi:hypothetical protein
MGATGRPPSKREAAERLIYKLLEDGGGKVEASTAYVAGETAGLSNTTLKEAREAIGVTGGRTWAFNSDRLPL